MSKLEVWVGPPDHGRRLDRFVRSLLGAVPPSLVQRLIRQGKVRLNGKRAHAGDRLAARDLVVVHHHLLAERSLRTSADTAPLLPQQISPTLRVLYQDAHYLAVDKPAGLSCQPHDAMRPSVMGWVERALADLIREGIVRPAVAHRLDVGTSGVVLVGLTARAITHFHRQLADAAVEKRYLVLAWGRPPRDRFEIDIPLRREGHARAKGPKMLAAAPGAGIACRTALRVLAGASDCSLLLARPLTGRTHQIRAHLLAAGFPVVGDPRYGDAHRDRARGIGPVARRPLLHALSLAFLGPDGPIRAVAESPGDFNRALAMLGLPGDARALADGAID